MHPDAKISNMASAKKSSIETMRLGVVYKQMGWTKVVENLQYFQSAAAPFGGQPRTILWNSGQCLVPRFYVPLDLFARFRVSAFDQNY